MWSHTIAILIGGQSSRMGMPKHEVVLPNGQTMLDMMISFAEKSASRVVVVGGPKKFFSNSSVVVFH